MSNEDFEKALQWRAELLQVSFFPIEKVTIRVSDHEKIEPSTQAYYAVDRKGTGTIYVSPNLQSYNARGYEATLKHELTHQWLDKLGLIEVENHHSSAFWQKYASVGVPEYMFMHDLIAEVKRRIKKYVNLDRDPVALRKNRSAIRIVKNFDRLLGNDSNLLCMLIFNSLKEIEDMPQEEATRLKLEGEQENNV